MPSVAGDPGERFTVVPARAGLPDEVGSALLSIFGAAPTRASVTFRELGLAQRLGRAAAALLLCWLLGALSVFIVLAHFVLVPGLFLAGPVLAYFRFRSVRVFLRIHGPCPRCGTEQDFKPPPWGRSIECSRCKNQLTLTVPAPPIVPPATAAGCAPVVPGR